MARRQGDQEETYLAKIPARTDITNECWPCEAASQSFFDPTNIFHDEGRLLPIKLDWPAIYACMSERFAYRAYKGNRAFLTQFEIRSPTWAAYYCDRMIDTPAPGFRPERLLALTRSAIDRCGLDLTDSVVLTEAASGAYAITPVLAAMAGAARVFALTRTSRYGTVDEIARATVELARRAGVADRVEIVSEKRADIIACADIVTNSGHLRPIDSATVSSMKPTAVVPLMYEAWEFRSNDVDLVACCENWIPVVGTNERHAAIDVFSFLGMMAIQLLFDAGIAVYRSRILLCCDNPFQEFVSDGLRRAGAEIHSVEELDDRCAMTDPDTIFIALRPRANPEIGDREAEIIARCYPRATVAQFLGDIDRAALARYGVAFWPLDSPAAGHQGILPSRIGPEPIVRLQCGGLKVGEIMARARRSQVDRQLGYDAAVAAAVASGFGQKLSEPTFFKAK